MTDPTLAAQIEALAPCPFCGGEAAIYENNDERSGEGCGLFFVRCDPCDLIYDKAWCVPREEAIAAWNTRPAIVTALRQAETYPPHIGDLHLGDRQSDGERLCSHGHPVPEFHPLYWPQQIGQYDDSDPCCLEHAIERYADHNNYPDPLRQAEAAPGVVEAYSPIERAAEKLLSAWRDTYRRERGGISERAPFRNQFDALALAFNEAMTANPIPLVRQHGAREGVAGESCEDCPPVGYPTNHTRCAPCPRRPAAPATDVGEAK